MDNQKQSAGQKNHSRSEFFYNKFSNMKVGLTRTERKLNAKQKSSKKKWIFIFIGIGLLALFGMFAVANSFINSDYYAYLTNNLVSKMSESTKQTGSVSGASRNAAGGVAMAVILGLKIFAVKCVVRILIIPMCIVIDSLTMILLYFVQGGLLKMFLNLMFNADSNSLKNAIIFIVLISVGSFVITIIISLIKKIVNDELEFCGRGADIVRDGINAMILIDISFFVHFCISIVATKLIVAASGTVGVHYYFSFSKIIFIFSQKNSGILGCEVERMLSYMPGDINDYFEYSLIEGGDGLMINGYDLTNQIATDTWFNGEAPSEYYYQGMSGMELFNWFDFDSNHFLDDSELVLYEEIMYGSNGLYIKWINDVTRILRHNLNVVLFIVAIWISGAVLFIMTIQLFIWIFRINISMFGKPFAAIFTYIDGGESFGKWKQNLSNILIKLILFVILYAIYIALLLEFSKLYSNWMLGSEIENRNLQFSASLFSIIYVLGGALAVIILPARMAGIITEFTAHVEDRMTWGGTKNGTGVATSSASDALSMAKEAASNVDWGIGGLGEKTANRGEASNSGPIKNNLQAMMEKSAKVHNKSSAE